MNPDTGDNLLLQTRLGDQHAARRLWSAHAPRLLVYARSVLRSHHDAEDAVQSVFCSILERPVSEIRGVRDPLAWLVRLARNTALNQARGAGRTRRRERTASIPEQRADAPEPELDNPLLRAVESLSPEHAELVTLKHFAGLTLEQVAWSLDLNRNTAAARLRAAYAALRALLEHPAARGASRSPTITPGTDADDPHPFARTSQSTARIIKAATHG